MIYEDMRPKTPEDIREELISILDAQDWQAKTILFSPTDDVELGFPEGNKAISKFYRFRRGDLEFPLSQEEITLFCHFPKNELQLGKLSIVVR